MTGSGAEGGMTDQQLPLFPLATVLFPGGRLPLRIFETRYVDMVSRCLRNDSGFGVCLIREGHEVGAAAETYEVGTLARIEDFDHLQDGLLGITVRGERRFRILDTRVQLDQLVLARVEYWPEETPCPLPGDVSLLVEQLQEMLRRTGISYPDLETRCEDANWVSYRLAELLPFELEARQHLLEITDPLVRLRRIQANIGQFSRGRPAAGDS